MAGPVVSAQVMLRPAGRGAPAQPPSTANLHEYEPDPDEAERAREWFTGQGFEAGPIVGTSFAVSAAPEVFERTFGASFADRQELPLTGLPGAVEAVSFAPPPDLF